MEDFKVTDNFSFFEATRTSNQALVDINRTYGLTRLADIELTCYLMEEIRCHVLSDHSTEVHSLTRAPSLNAKTFGSAKTSQHILAQACDWSPWGAESREECWRAFVLAKHYLTVDRIMFGQLIFEEAERFYGKVHWIHLSRGYPYRPLKNCGQIMTMKNGKYTLTHQAKVWTW